MPVGASHAVEVTGASARIGQRPAFSLDHRRVRVRASIDSPAVRPGVGIGVAVATTSLWLAFLAANGPALRPDTHAYLRVADGFRDFRILTSPRMPGYPLFLVAVRALADRLGTDFATTVAVVQTLLLAALGTGLVFALASRMTGRTAVGVAAALLFALDTDVQWFGAVLLTEALTVTLVAGMAWLRVRDGRWRRTAWILAALAVVRPNFVVFPFAFGLVDALRLRRPRALLAPILPTIVVLATWWTVASAAGADPARPLTWFGPIHTFTKVYESDLWRALPDGPERRLLADQRARGVDASRAADAVESAAGPGSVLRVARSTIHADPSGYVRVCLAVIPLEFRGGTWSDVAEMGFTHPQPALLRRVRRFHAKYGGIFYGSFVSFVLFVALFAGACWNGFGWDGVAQPFREVFAPFVATLLLSVAFTSAGTTSIARLAVEFHPFNALLWAAALGRAGQHAAAWWARRPHHGPVVGDVAERAPRAD